MILFQSVLGSIMQKVAIICADGIGDFLLMGMLAFNASINHDVTLFHPQHTILDSLFNFCKVDHFDHLDIDHFDQIIVQNDHSNRAYKLNALRNHFSKIRFIFPKDSHLIHKGDFLFNQDLSFIENLKTISSQLFQSAIESNSLETQFVSLKKDPLLVILHPTSKNPKKNWPINNWLRLYKLIQQEGFNPKIVVSESEYFLLKDQLAKFDTFIPETLKDLANFMKDAFLFIGNESGLGHLASSLKIPTITIASNPQVAKIWRPCFYQNRLITLKYNIPRLLRDLIWHRMITIDHVKEVFLHEIRELQNLC